jgi:hypothetical protein
LKKKYLAAEIRLGEPWLVVLLGSKRCSDQFARIWQERERAFKRSVERESEAAILLQQASCIVSLRGDYGDPHAQATRLSIRLGKFSDDWSALTTLGAFVARFGTEGEGPLSLIIDPAELESYRIGSMISSYCQEKEKKTTISGPRGERIEPLYSPPINITTKLCLVSLIDYVVRTGDLPNFDRLREYHFENLPALGMTGFEGVKRNWGSNRDSKYVASLYATLRTLEMHSLVEKTITKRRKMDSIQPTWNAVYAVVFSDVLPLFKQLHGQELPTLEEETHTEENPIEFLEDES